LLFDVVTCLLHRLSDSLRGRLGRGDNRGSLDGGRGEWRDVWLSCSCSARFCSCNAWTIDSKAESHASSARRPTLQGVSGLKCQRVKQPVFPWRQRTPCRDGIARLKFSEPERVPKYYPMEHLSRVAHSLNTLWRAMRLL
jgi:hypothetical protein